MAGVHICFAYGDSILYRKIYHSLHFPFLRKFFQRGARRMDDFFSKAKNSPISKTLRFSSLEPLYFPGFGEIDIAQNKNRLLEPTLDSFP
ncbi:MAG: hypothetical protein A2359_01725 [Candidatus Moranbacteria bacterium RIFOXYB1_FULL_43_19]|nr:MAG: hypothetical protein A2359_01725 [Candidatus Moranbacteria bacterium RIFOXYB1_FULL_43_19]OGI33049.1 MAG: hypothetical protein A2420_04500 [Candidatus Moranbacteria bacterium RIFOXYC1_FULL_44_13]